MTIEIKQADLAMGEKKVMELAKKGTNKIISKIMSLEVALTVPAGLKRVGMYWVPLVPSGWPIAQILIEKAHMEIFKLRVDPHICAVYIAKAMSMIAPMCPKIGFSLLLKDMEKCISLWKKGKPKLFGMMFSKATINYYKRGRIK